MSRPAYIADTALLCARGQSPSAVATALWRRRHFTVGVLSGFRYWLIWTTYSLITKMKQNDNYLNYTQICTFVPTTRLPILKT